MSVQLASAYMQIIPSMQGFQGTISRQLTGEGVTAGRTVGTQFSGGFKSIVGAGAIAGAVGGLAGAAAGVVGGALRTGFSGTKNAIIGFNSTLQQSSIGFTTMLGSAQKADGFVRQLQAFAAKTPFEFQGLVQNSNSLLGMGVSASDVIPDLTALGDSVASVGGNSTVLNNTISAFGQTMAKGTLDMGNMNQLLQGGVPNALKILASSYHVTTGAMVKMISAGKVQSADALPRLIKGIEQGTSATAALGGMMDKQSVTFQGAMSNIADASTQLLAKAFKPLFDQASLGANHLAAVLGSPQMTVWAGRISAATTTAIGFFTRLQSAVGSLFTSMASGGGFSQLTGFLSQMGAALAPLIPGFIQAVTAFSPLRIALEALAPVFPVITLALTQLGSALGQGLAAAVAAIAPGIVAMTNGLVQLLVPLLETPALVQAVVLGFIAWKVASAGFQFAGIIVGLAQTTVQLGVNALAWVRNAAAQLASKAETVAIMGLYAGEFVANLVRAGAALAVQAGQWIANTAAMLASKAQTVAIMGLYAGEFVANLVRAGAALAVQAAQWIATTAAMIASRAAYIAGAAATGIATAAQWALNAAMDANPIGIVVLAIAALVAGLIWFFTQTKLGQAIWQGFVNFLIGAWNTIVAVAQVVWGAIVAAITTRIALIVNVIRTTLQVVAAAWQIEWNLIRTVVTTVWNAIVSVVTSVINRVRSVITSVVAAVVGLWRAEWDTARSIVTAAWNAIVSFVRNGINTALSIIRSVLGTILSTISSIWHSVISAVSSAWNGIVSAIRGGVSNAISVVTGFGSRVISTVTGIGSQLFSAGRSMIQHLIDGISSMIGAAGNAIGSVVSHVASFLPHSPAKRGPLSGSGWMAVYTAGRAVTAQFAAGLDADAAGNAASRMLTNGTAAIGAHIAGSANAVHAVAPAGNVTHLTYVAAPNQSYDREQDLRDFMRRKTVLTGQR